MNSENELRLTELEIRMAYLERHTSDQDRVILGLTERIDHLERRCATLQSKLAQASEHEFAGSDEKPPHY